MNSLANVDTGAGQDIVNLLQEEFGKELQGERENGPTWVIEPLEINGEVRGEVVGIGSQSSAKIRDRMTAFLRGVAKGRELGAAEALEALATDPEEGWEAEEATG